MVAVPSPASAWRERRGGVLRYWLIRHGDFRAVSQVAIVQSVVRAASQVVFGLLGGGVVGLLLSDVLGRVLGLGSVIRSAWGTLAAAHAGATVGTRAVAREYWRFPVFGAPSSLLNAAAAALPVPLLAGVYGLPIAVSSRSCNASSVCRSVSSGRASATRCSAGCPNRPARIRQPPCRSFDGSRSCWRRSGCRGARVGADRPGPLRLRLRGAMARRGNDRGADGPMARGGDDRESAQPGGPRVPGPGTEAHLRRAEPRRGRGSILGGSAAGLDAFETIRLLAWLQALAYGVYLVVLYRLVVAGSARQPRV